MGNLEDNLKKAMKSKSMKGLMKSGKFKDADDKIKKIELDKMNNAMPKKGLAGGGKVKGYTGGGKVRGCGMARKGTRPVKMVMMKGSG
jgi:hypothetical protein